MCHIHVLNTDSIKMYINVKIEEFYKPVTMLASYQNQDHKSYFLHQQ